MAQKSPDPIEKADIIRYLNDYSDFCFELQVIRELNKLEIKCSHGGTYEDPVTKKSREYDIRALIDRNIIRVHLSIECKNLRKNFPLITHCIKRSECESYNEWVFTYPPDVPRQSFGPVSLPIPGGIEFCKNIRTPYNLYPKEQFVAKSFTQIGKRLDNNEIISNDEEIFDKLSQAINSSVDLISEAKFLNSTILTNYFSLIIPVLIIPDETLWQVKYSDDGKRIGEPSQIDHISYYIGKVWTDTEHQNLDYTISHLEIITRSEIQNFIEKYLGDYISLCFDDIKSIYK